ncbi:YitT family protein [Parafilimonas sp.]|uniref:YitT family protein n=1 Tax=Parafilimonas sp. TaxID=1969739 RepID=UPI0039E5444D
MHKFYRWLIIFYNWEGTKKKGSAYSSFEIAKGQKQLKKNIIRSIRNWALIICGIFSAACGLKSFLLPNRFIDGGATGISLLTAEVTGASVSALLVLVNIPFVLLGYKTIGRIFAIKTIITITGLAVVVAFLKLPEITHDALLVAVFGGFFLGAGIGLSIRGGAVLDGTEILAIFLSKKLNVSIGDIIIIVNAIIFSFAAYFLTIETALYSMITYLAASRTLDFVIEGIEEYIGVTIISVHNEKIKRMIIDVMGRGVTIYKGSEGFGKSGENKERDILYTVITRLELSKLTAEIDKIDSGAFIVMNSVKDTKGGMIKKRPLKH